MNEQIEDVEPETTGPVRKGNGYEVPNFLFPKGDFVNIAEAIGLRELGFNQPTETYYDRNFLVSRNSSEPLPYNMHAYVYARPTREQADVFLKKNGYK